jgi:hypothetical protein
VPWQLTIDVRLIQRESENIEITQRLPYRMINQLRNVIRGAPPKNIFIHKGTRVIIVFSTQENLERWELGFLAVDLSFELETTEGNLYEMVLDSLKREETNSQRKEGLEMRQYNHIWEFGTVGSTRSTGSGPIEEMKRSATVFTKIKKAKEKVEKAKLPVERRTMILR